MPATAASTSNNIGSSLRCLMSRNAAIAIKTPAISVIEDGMIITVAARMRDTTTGRMPLNMAFTGPRSRYLRNNLVKIKTTTTEGSTAPVVAMDDPAKPATLYPTNVAALMPTGPGVTWEIATTSIN